MIRRLVESSIPTDWGNLRLIAYGENMEDLNPHLVLIKEPLEQDMPVLTRIHSECMTGDIFGSKRCDCGPQLHKSLELISHSGGVLIYLRQEGRGIGIVNKLKAYGLQDLGINTADANIHLGFKADERSYEQAIIILNDLEISQINLLTNNPEKIKAFKNSSVKLIKRIPLEVSPGLANQKYLETKKTIMGHLLDLK